MDEDLRTAWRALETALAEGRHTEVVMGLLHAVARLFQFVETAQQTPDLGIVLLDAELETPHGPADTPGTRAALEALRAVLAASARKPN